MPGAIISNTGAPEARLRIALVAACPFPLARGTPVRIQRMAEALAERGHDVHVITYHLGYGELPAQVHVHRMANLRFYRKRSPGPSPVKLAIVDPLLARRLRRTLREQPFDVIHAHHYEGLLVAAAARVGLRIPLIYDAHTLLSSELPYYNFGLPKAVKRAVGRWFDRQLPKLAEHTICVTQTIRERLIGECGFAPERVSVIMNGVEVEHFDPAAQAATRTHERPTVIFTGNLAGYQRIDLLLQAFQQVIASIPDARLLIASDSSFAPYEALARQLGVREHIELIDSPKFDELPALLAGADVAVNPRTDGDGVPVKLLNYMAAGRAVVSFASSAPGVIHGQTGWLAEPGNVRQFAEGVVALLRDPEASRRLGQAARRYIQDNCRWPLVAERCEAVYRALGEAHMNRAQSHAAHALLGTKK